MKDVFVAGENKRDENDRKRESEEERKPLQREPEEYSEVIRNEPAAKSRMAAFMVRPDGLKFETQDEEEKILVLLRKHVVTNLGWILTLVLLVMVPLGFGFFPLLEYLSWENKLLLLLMWYLALFGYGFEKFLTWYFNVYIITDERIIDYDFYSLLYKRVSEAKIDRIEDITFSMGGTLMNLFNYGDVYIQTAGEQRELDFEAVPNPEKVVKLVNELVIEEEREKLEGRVR